MEKRRCITLFSKIPFLRGPLTIEQVNDFIPVMEKIGLKRDLNGDFAHPKLAADHPLSQHTLYRLIADKYLQAEK